MADSKHWADHTARFELIVLPEVYPKEKILQSITKAMYPANVSGRCPIDAGGRVSWPLHNQDMIAASKAHPTLVLVLDAKYNTSGKDEYKWRKVYYQGECVMEWSPSLTPPPIPRDIVESSVKATKKFLTEQYNLHLQDLVRLEQDLILDKSKE